MRWFLLMSVLFLQGCTVIFYPQEVPAPVTNAVPVVSENIPLPMKIVPCYLPSLDLLSKLQPVNRDEYVKLRDLKGYVKALEAYMKDASELSKKIVIEQNQCKAIQ